MPKAYKTDRDKALYYRALVVDATNKIAERHKEAKDLNRRYRNELQSDDFSVGGHHIGVPAGISVVDSMYAALTSVNVDFNVRNLAHGTKEAAKLAEVGLREVWREAKGQRKSGYNIKDSLIPGISWLKVGYDHAVEKKLAPKSDDEMLEERDEILVQADQQGLPTPNPQELSELIAPNKEVEEVTRSRVVLDYVSWKDLIFDPTADKLEDVRWHCHIIRLPIDEVKNNPVYQEYCRQRKQLGKLNELEPDINDRYVSEEDIFHGFIDEDMRQYTDDRISLYEFWNHETGTFCVFAKYSDFLLYEDANPFAINEDLVDRSPFVPLIIREDPENVWGLSDIKVILPLLDELNFYRGMLANYLERMVPKVAGTAEAFDDATRAAFESKEPGVFVPLAGGGTYSGNDLKALDPPQLPSEVYKVIERILDDMREATGLNEVLRGLFPDRKSTATETAAVVEAGTSRQSEKRNKLEEFYINVARRILMLMQLYYDEERVSRLTMEDADEIWVWNKEDIVMEADLEVSLSPKEAVTPQTKAEKALASVNFLGALPDTLVNKRPLIKRALEDMGYDEQFIQEVLVTEEEAQKARMEQAQDQATQAQAGQGVVDPSMIGGPMDAQTLLETVNPGERPDQFGPEPEDVDELAQLTGGATPTGGPNQA